LQKNRIFAKIVFLQKSWGSGKVCKNWKKVFCRIWFLGEGQGEFCKNPIGLSQKSCFSKRNPIFLQCLTLHPHGVGGSNPKF
jgi:hypothetical protein